MARSGGGWGGIGSKLGLRTSPHSKSAAKEDSGVAHLPLKGHPAGKELEAWLILKPVLVRRRSYFRSQPAW